MLYRAVELYIDGTGRLQKVGPVWQPTLELARAAAQRIALTTTAIRVYVESSEGRVVADVLGKQPDRRMPQSRRLGQSALRA